MLTQLKYDISEFGYNHETGVQIASTALGSTIAGGVCLYFAYKSEKAAAEESGRTDFPQPLSWFKGLFQRDKLGENKKTLLWLAFSAAAGGLVGYYGSKKFTTWAKTEIDEAMQHALDDTKKRFTAMETYFAELQKPENERQYKEFPGFPGGHDEKAPLPDCVRELYYCAINIQSISRNPNKTPSENIEDLNKKIRETENSYYQNLYTHVIGLEEKRKVGLGQEYIQAQKGFIEGYRRDRPFMYDKNIKDLQKGFTKENNPDVRKIYEEAIEQEKQHRDGPVDQRVGDAEAQARQDIDVRRLLLVFSQSQILDGRFYDRTEPAKFFSECRKKANEFIVMGDGYQSVVQIYQQEMSELKQKFQEVEQEADNIDSTIQQEEKRSMGLQTIMKTAFEHIAASENNKEFFDSNGQLKSTAQFDPIYRRFAAYAHPDKNGGEYATEAMAILNELKNTKLDDKQKIEVLNQYLNVQVAAP